MPNFARLFSIKDEIYDLFCSLFHDQKVATKEWETIWKSNLRPQDTLKLISQRFKTVNKISAAKWKNPVHIVGQLLKYRKIPSYQAALDLLNEAKKAYKNNFLPLISGNLSLSFEVGFNRPTDGTSEPVFNIHAHIICEEACYNNYLNATKELRSGKSSKQHILATRKCKRQKQQNNTNYVFDVANYNSKFSLLQGMSRNNKRANTLPNAKEYHQAKLRLMPVTRLKKPKKSEWKADYMALKQLISQYLKWHILLTMQQLNLQVGTLKSVKFRKKCVAYQLFPHYNIEIYSFPDSS